MVFQKTTLKFIFNFYVFSVFKEKLCHITFGRAESYYKKIFLVSRKR